MRVAEADHEHGHEAEQDASAGEGKRQRQYRAARNMGNLRQVACRCCDKAECWYHELRICELLGSHLPRIDSVRVATADMSARRDDSAGLPAPLPPTEGADAPASRGVASAMLTAWLQLLRMLLISEPSWCNAARRTPGQ